MSHYESLLSVTQWLEWLPLPQLKRAKLFKRELDSYMHEMVLKRREDIAAGKEKKDLLTALVQAVAREKSAANKTSLGAKVEVMDDEELIGNMFIFLLAGHETSECQICF